jgi:hypothetical protein
MVNDTIYIVTKKEEINGEILAEVSQSVANTLGMPRKYIIDKIAQLTQELADMKKLLVDVDAMAVSITP